MTSCAILLPLLSFCSLPTHADDELIAQEEEAFAAAVANVAGSVVRIETVGGVEKIGNVLAGTGPSTGMVVSSDGHIVSSSFNFAQQPASILVTLADGTRAPARIVARDHSRMLVLLRVDVDSPLPVAEPLAEDGVRVGQWAIAVGRGDRAEQPNVAVGIVSAKGRIYGRALQTDAKISPRNYGGPLIDLHGRVLGILVPMSPQGSNAVAGLEWYDGGIGFAVPLTTVLNNLPRWTKGEDLHSGLLGIGVKGGDPYQTPAEVSSVRPRSPAVKAGIKVGDRITGVGETRVSTHMQLRIALGSRYAGEELKLRIRRGEDQLNLTATLVDELPVYAHPFLGLLPERPSADEEIDELLVRFVFAKSPAEQAGVKIGDRIVAIGEKEVANVDEARTALASLEPGNEVALSIVRDGAPQTIQVKTRRVSSDVPERLPANEAQNDAEDGLEAEDAVESEFQLPESPNKALLYVPASYSSGVAHGLLVWMHASGGDKRDELFARFRRLCETRQMIMLAPQAADPKQWKRDEAEFARKAMDKVIADYQIDPRRIVVHGYQAGGAMAYMMWMQHRELVRGVAPIDAPMPRGFSIPDSDPQFRDAIYTGYATKSRFATRIKQGVEALQAQRHPVAVTELGEDPRYLNAAELEHLGRWIDSLDRF